ncbi:hypothetical protein ABGT16_04560 [Pseudomonas asiatica]|uniref:hypothetical protein n=1 Tax=Pseudomonas asiatica TaxID=2219225 RepID=UPI00345D36D7
MSSQTLLLLTNGYAIALGICFGWTKRPKSFAFWSVFGAVLVEVTASGVGLNSGFSDTLWKQLVIVIGLGAPIFVICRHGSIWRAACKPPYQTKKITKKMPGLCIHLVTLTNFWLPGLGVILTGIVTLIGRYKAPHLVSLLVDSLRFQAGLTILLLGSFLTLAMPIGIYISSLIMLYGAGKILVGTTVVLSGFEYRFCNSPSLYRLIKGRFGRKRSISATQGL